VAKETHSPDSPSSPASSSPPSPSRLARGAAEAAPTAPHATPRGKLARGEKKSGPEKFWDARRWRIAFGVMLFVSLVIHFGVSPWNLLPRGLEMRTVEGDTAIPVELLQDDEPPEKTVEQQGSDPAAGNDPGALATRDAGTTRDAAGDAEAGALDGSKPTDAASDVEDAGGEGAAPSDAAPRDPVAMVGAAGAVQAGDPLVVLLVNAVEIRKNPVGAQMGPLLSAIPQWDDFMAGTNIDPIQQTDWMLISGPGLVDTTNDVILVHYSAPDAVVDKAIDLVSKKYDRGGPFDAGVPGVKAAIGHADRAPRVFLRPQPGLLAVVPPHYANTAARILVHAKVSPRVRPGEAVRLKVSKPYQPFPDIPRTVSELRLWVMPRSDEGADVFAEGDCANDADAADAAKQIKGVLDRYRRNVFVRAMTHGLLDSLEVTSEGKLVKLHLEPTREQLEVLLGIIAGQIRSLKGAPPPPPPAPLTPPSGIPAPAPPPLPNPSPATSQKPLLPKPSSSSP
jgi:hypothetical protein